MSKKNTKKPSSFELPNGQITPTISTPQQQPVSIEQAMKAAEQLQGQGQLQQAEKIVRNILNQAPKYAPAMHLLGVIAHNVGKTDVAIDLIEQAIKINGKVPLFHANLAEMYRRLERYEEAVEAGKKAVKLAPDFLFAHSNLGIAYFDLKDYDNAEKHQKIALKLNPDFAPSLNNYGSILRNRDYNYKEAEKYFHKAIKANPNLPDAYNNLGEVLVRLDDPEEALKVLHTVIQKDPNHESAWCNRGLALLALGKGEESKQSYFKAISINEKSVGALAGVCMVALEYDLYALGEEAAERLVAVAPEEADSHSMYAALLMAQGKDQEAEKLYQKALSIKDDCAGALVGLGNIEMERGNLKAAEELFSRCVEQNNEHSSSGLYSLIQVKKIKPDMPEIAMMEEEAKRLDGKLIDSKAISLNFALGKMYDDLGEYEKGFPYYIEGCRIKNKSMGYSKERREQNVADIKKVFTKDFIKKHAKAGDNSKEPIFILGMPRSGTTLTEQIISSHPNVYGAGELKELTNLVKAHANEENADGYATSFANVTDKELKKMGEDYIRQLKEYSSDSPHITDKMPGNFNYIGLIRTILPNAKIVHINRHPLDNCISCFTRLFAHGQSYSYDLSNVGHYYKTYHDIMNYWRETLPEGSFYDLQYERLVDDTESEAKKLIEYCGLEWDPKCLEFYKNKRSIRTASVTQVRQPIYKSSKQRWKNYDKFLDLMKEELGDILKLYE